MAVRSAISKKGLPSTHIHWPKTLIQKGQQALAPEHLNYRLRLTQGSRCYCLLLDCSASMLNNNKLSLAKGLILALSKQVYQERGEIALIGFRGDTASILKAPGQFTTINDHWIGAIDGGGATPISKAISAAEALLTQYRWPCPISTVDCYLLSDCRFRELPQKINGATHHTIIDFEQGPITLGRAKKLAQQWQADYVRAMDFLAET